MKNGPANEKSLWRNRSRRVHPFCCVINFIGKAILFVIRNKLERQTWRIKAKNKVQSSKIH